ncbi:MAG: tetratricopeptide repeat protein, partial [Tannerella sp.]|nr:tetratricopeptide repeat protein [Tannerella sp.]
MKAKAILTIIALLAIAALLTLYFTGTIEWKTCIGGGGITSIALALAGWWVNSSGSKAGQKTDNHIGKMSGGVTVGGNVTGCNVAGRDIINYYADPETNKLVKENSRKLDKLLAQQAQTNDPSRELELYRRIDEVTKEKDRLTAQLEEAKKYYESVRNPSKENEEAHRLLQEGKLEELHRLLPESKLREKEKQDDEQVRQDAVSRVIKGQAFEMDNEYAEAEKQYLRAVDICPSFDNFLVLGNYYFRQNNHAEAEAAYKKALAIASDDSEKAGTLNNLAVLHDDIHKYAEAEKEYAEALEIRRRLSAANPSAYEPYVA